MNLASLPKISQRSAKRVGRGIGSGKGGHNSGRGTKGQKARSKVRVGFEGTKNKKSYIKRLPYLRGKGRFKAWSTRYTPVSLDKLSDWPEKTEISQENLVKKGFIRLGETAKLVAGGKIKKLKTGWTVKVATAKSLQNIKE